MFLAYKFTVLGVNLPYLSFLFYCIYMYLNIFYNLRRILQSVLRLHDLRFLLTLPILARISILTTLLFIEQIKTLVPHNNINQ